MSNTYSNIPYADNFFKISFKSSDHILVKIKLWIYPAMCLNSKPEMIKYIKIIGRKRMNVV